MNPVEKAVEDVKGRIKSFDGRAGRINEADTIRVLITPMIEALGWDTLDLDEVQSEYRHKAGDDPVDYALFVDGSPVLFIEAKALDKNLNDRKWIVQTLNYANACNVPWTVLTNGEEWRVYKVHVQREAEEKLFYSTRLTSVNASEAAKRLIMFARESMAPKPALDKLWHEAEVDQKMRLVIENLHENKPAVKAMARASNGLEEQDVYEALRRLKLRADWRDDEDMFPTRVGENACGTQETAIAQQDTRTPDPKSFQSKPLNVDKAKRQPTGTFNGKWPEKATHIMYAAGYCGFGHSDPESQKISVLSGSSIVKSYENDKYLSKTIRRWKEEKIESRELVPEGEGRLTLLSNTPPLAPSAAAGLVACGSRDGWKYWKDPHGNELQKLRSS